ncbi:hypothetical protein ACWD0Z_09945 [Streptomyces sp. NPDC003007]
MHELGQALVALVSADDLRRLEVTQELAESAEEQVVGAVSTVREVASAPGEPQRFGIAAERHRAGSA